MEQLFRSLTERGTNGCKRSSMSLYNLRHFIHDRLAPMRVKALKAWLKVRLDDGSGSLFNFKKMAYAHIRDEDAAKEERRVTMQIF